MTFTAPLGLLALLGIPAVVVLHLYRRRLRERRAAAVFLFAGARLVTDAGRRRTRLLRTPSLWFECLMALAIALWLAGPSFGGMAARHVVFVLDDSASMQAGAADLALAAVRERVSALRSQDRVSVLRTGPGSEILVGPRSLPSEVGVALLRYRPSRPRHDPGPTLDLARELASNRGEVVFCTDEAAPYRASDITVLALGTAVPNAAILTAQRFRRGSGDEELHLRIARFGALFETGISVHAGEVELLRRVVDLTAGTGDLALVLPPGTGAVRLELADDALAIDNTAWLLPEPVRTVQVCDLLTDETRERLELDRVFAALSGHALDADPLRAQLVLAEQPGHPLAGQTEVVIDPGLGERDGWRGPFVVDRGHAWLTGLHLHGVVWLAGKDNPPGRVLAAVADRTLLSEEFVGAGRRLWINLDSGAGNVMRSPDWPLLFSNLLDACRDEVPGPVHTNIILGDEARFRRSLIAGSADADLWLESPEGLRVSGRGDRVVGWIVEQPGLFRVFDKKETERATFAVRFHDPSESDLRGLVSRESQPSGDGEGANGSLRDTSVERRLLGFLLLLLALADWWVLAGRGR